MGFYDIDYPSRNFDNTPTVPAIRVIGVEIDTRYIGRQIWLKGRLGNGAHEKPHSCYSAVVS